MLPITEPGTDGKLTPGLLLARSSTTWLLFSLVPGTLFVSLLVGFAYFPLPWTASFAWIPALGLDFSIRVDGLSAQFLALILGIGTLVFIYAAGYLAQEPHRLRVLVLLLLFMMAMIGCVVTDHLLVLFVFWELTSVLSFLLIGFQHQSKSNRKTAQQAWLVTGVGGLFLLAGIILLGLTSGTYSIQQTIARAPGLLDDVRVYVAMSFIFLGAFSKSAQFPFHFWLPNAMAAPTPVSAYLHSATMVKLGIYLLARLDAAFSDVLYWEVTLLAVGTLTAVNAAIQTLRERDLKRILAWSTVASLGLLTMLVGLPGQGAALAVAAFFWAHALYKAPLFFVVGNLDHHAGTRLIDHLTGMRRYMPWTAAAALLAALSMAGLPLSFGFVAKDAVAMAKADVDVFTLVSYATVLVASVSVAVAAIAALRVFWGRETPLNDSQLHEAPWTMWAPPMLLAVLGLVFGMAPMLVNPLLGAAAIAMAPGLDITSLGTSYDQGPVLSATFSALIFGMAIFLGWDRLSIWLNRAKQLDEMGPEAAYWRELHTLTRLATWQTRLLQHGLLPRYLLTLILCVTFAVAVMMLLAVDDWEWPAVHPWSWPLAAAATLIILAAAAAVWMRDRLVLILVCGLVGYGSGVLFLFAGAPDLAMAQFAVETVLVIVAAAVLLRLRRIDPRADAQSQEPRTRVAALLAASAFGITLSVMLLVTAGLPMDSSLAEFYGEQSLPAGHGRNVVNVIIVDFRALDTLGEIAVMTFALLAALPLLTKASKRDVNVARTI